MTSAPWFGTTPARNSANLSSVAPGTRVAWARSMNRHPMTVASARMFLLLAAAGASAIACDAEVDPTPDPAEIQLDAPKSGVQLKTPIFDVAPGTERQHCYWFKLPSDVDLDVVKFEVRYLSGSHHMNLFQTDKDMPDGEGDCLRGVFSPMGTNGYNLIVGSQSDSLDWQLPEGVAFKIKARKQLMLQTHYVNAATQNTPMGKGRVKVNLHTEVDKSKIKAHMGTVFANNVNINIPPRETRAFTTSCSMPKDVKVAALTGHFHSRGKTFSVNLSPDGTSATDEIYRSRSWDEPPFKVLDPPAAIPNGGAFQYTCEFTNPTENTIKFGPEVEKDEHCNLFAYVYPWDADEARYCF